MHNSAPTAILVTALLLSACSFVPPAPPKPNDTPCVAINRGAAFLNGSNVNPSTGRLRNANAAQNVEVRILNEDLSLAAIPALRADSKEPASGLITVAQAKSMRDDVWVVLEGQIVRQIGNELYESKDDSGSISI